MKLFDKIFSSKKQPEKADFTTVSRKEILEGFRITGIIHNLNYHLTDINVYSDGLVDCWEMVDLELLRHKIDSGWLVPSVADGQYVSQFGLGRWQIERGNWLYDKESLHSHYCNLVQQLNPKMENLRKTSESATQIGGVNVASHYGSKGLPYHFEGDSPYLKTRVEGKSFSIFFREDDAKTYLAQLSLYKNGLVEISNIPSKKRFDFENLTELANSGKITCDPEIGETVHILGLGSFAIKAGEGLDMHSKLSELEDELAQLNGGESSLAKCRRIFEEYKEKPSETLRETLKIAYESIPVHLRMFVGDMDSKDHEVRTVIYGK